MHLLGHATSAIYSYRVYIFSQRVSGSILGAADFCCFFAYPLQPPAYQSPPLATGRILNPPSTSHPTGSSLSTAGTPISATSTLALAVRVTLIRTLLHWNHHTHSSAVPHARHLSCQSSPPLRHIRPRGSGFRRRGRRGR
jgi:hypothetical protein